jgi:hypothetical protein
MTLKANKIDSTRNQRQARRREREKKWLEQNGWRSWEGLHTALINGSARLVMESAHAPSALDDQQISVTTDYA